MIFPYRIFPVGGNGLFTGKMTLDTENQMRNILSEVFSAGSLKALAENGIVSPFISTREAKNNPRYGRHVAKWIKECLITPSRISSKANSTQYLSIVKLEELYLAEKMKSLPVDSDTKRHLTY